MWIIFIIINILIHQRCCNADFDPYVMNGGLVSAIAGRDYMIMATDTRLMGPSGYDILERHHIATRIWSPFSIEESDLIAPDGSIDIKLQDELQNVNPSLSSSSSSSSSLRLLRESIIHSHSSKQQQQSPPFMIIGSVGCQVDSEELKRTIRSELRRAIYFGEISNDSINSVAAATSTCITVSMDSMAVLLSQVLYSRRTFPFGCYCVLGGLSEMGTGQVYVYDAIGSYEPVAVACTGTGFELLQPILDRQFHPFTPSSVQLTTGTATSQYGTNIIRPSALQVDCPTVEEAIRILMNAYRSVSEREIGVGDHVVFYSIQRIQRHEPVPEPEHMVHDTINNDDALTKSCSDRKNISAHVSDDEHSLNVVYQSRIWTAPLKKH